MIARTLTTILLAAAAIAPVQAALFGSHAKDCIPRHAIRTESAESETSLIFHASGGRAYRNTLPEPCDGLKSVNNTSNLGIDSKDLDMLCAGDLVWLKGSKLFGTTDDDSTRCKLGTFEPITEMSLTESLRR